MTSVYGQRLAAVQSIMARHQVDCLLLGNPVNIRYFTGYWTILSGASPTALAIGRDGKTSLFFPALERPSLPDLGVEVDSTYPWRAYSLTVSGVLESPRPFEERLRELLGHLPKACRVGTDGAGLFEPAAILAGHEMISLGHEIASLRLRKGPEEIRDLERAFRICASAVDSARRGIHVGTPEAHIAGLIGRAILEGGGMISHIVVGSGPRAALAHPLATERTIGPRDPVLIDIGVMFNGYWVELARTFMIDPTDEWQKRYDLVKRAQDAGLKALREGARACDVDGAIRNVFSGAGYDGRYFTHSAGHGCGLLGADGPAVSPSDTGLLVGPSVWSLEPALYFSGEGGVRLEDAFLLDGQSAAPLAPVPYGLKP